MPLVVHPSRIRKLQIGQGKWSEKLLLSLILSTLFLWMQLKFIFWGIEPHFTIVSKKKNPQVINHSHSSNKFRFSLVWIFIESLPLMPAIYSHRQMIEKVLTDAYKQWFHHFTASTTHSFEETLSKLFLWQNNWTSPMANKPDLVYMVMWFWQRSQKPID